MGPEDAKNLEVNALLTGGCNTRKRCQSLETVKSRRFLLKKFFELKDNCFTVLCWFYQTE